MTETELMRAVLLEAPKYGARLFRNNVAEGWIGASSGPFQHDCQIFVRKGSVVIADARRLHAGLVKGSGDLIGWRIGDGKFVSTETKSKTGRLTDEQRNFMAQVLNAGGIAGCVRSIEEFRKLMEGL